MYICRNEKIRSSVILWVCVYVLVNLLFAVTQGWKAFSWLTVLGDTVSGKGMSQEHEASSPTYSSVGSRQSNGCLSSLSLLLFVQFWAPAYEPFPVRMGLPTIISSI